MLHCETLEIPEKGGARLMVMNMIKSLGKAFLTANGVVDSRSAPAHR